MITYRMMDASCPLPTCLHKGSLSLAYVVTEPAYVETVSDIPTGSVARTLRAISDRYGACGVLAIDGEMAVGKIRAFPQAILDRMDLCLQEPQYVRPLLALDLAALPSREESPVLHLLCIQVAGAYAGRGIAGGMLDALLAWARAEGWREARANAVSNIPPLLNWCGQLSRGALEHRGFTVTRGALSPPLREGVVSQRAGAHGEAVKRQWEPFVHLSDDEAGTMFEMTLNLS